jgi:hypothetical protein
MTDTLIDRLNKEDVLRRAGTQLSPLFTWRGRDVYPVHGAEGDDAPVVEPDSGPDEDESKETGEDGSEDSSEKVSRADFEKLRSQLQAADKGRAALEKKLKEIDDAKKDELTKANEKVDELEKQRTKDGKEIADLRLQNAFLTADTGITWHDPADALALAERQGYLAEVVGEDGKVDAAKLKVKLQELAKAKPHLVNKSSGEEEQPRSTGAKVGSKGTGGGSKENKLPSRYDKYLR